MQELTGGTTGGNSMHPHVPEFYGAAPLKNSWMFHRERFMV
jgi:hypothetical protein